MITTIQLFGFCGALLALTAANYLNLFSKSHAGIERSLRTRSWRS